ncbi:uncharacterized protein [Montipora capricornis]|uniref:uncharacterized protein n=1 Tax=Montipora capricornis TaxID=246305 RepID=UPI0035F1CA7B
MTVLIGNHGIYARCATVETSLSAWSTECKTNKTAYIWGNAVRIETKAKILKLCEVKVFAETFGNIAVDHDGTDQEYINKTFPTTVGGLYGSACIYSTIRFCGHQTTSCIRWRVEFGSNLRVAGIFLQFNEESHRKISTIIKTGMGKNERICFEETSAYYRTPAVYHWCKNTHVASYVEMGIGSRGLEVCEVEIFQTKTINVAARRKARKFMQVGNIVGISEAGAVCDQNMYTKIWVFNRTTVVVDLLTMIEVHLIRIRAEYLVDGMEHRVYIGPSYEKQSRVYNVTFSAKKTIRDLRLGGNNVGRTVGVEFRTTQILKFQIRELEIYNGRLPEIENKCLKEDYCPPNFKCKILPAEFLCECPTEGFRYVKGGNGTSEQCLDINECTIKSLCPAHSYCTNTVGSYRCVCEKGYEAINDSNHRLEKCEDINECEDLFRVVYSTPCHFNSKCINLPGSYTCKCLPGYKASQNRDYCVENRMYMEDCLDVDECSQETHRCHLNATCTNTIGSYSCRCFSGMKGDGRTCIALDPCTKERKCKRHYQKCLHINGEFLCDCVDGYSNRLRDCEDSNECDLDENICGNNSVCNNTVGSYRCLCKPGFYDASGNGTNCIDINECALEKTICGDNAVCNNIHGSYGCECSPGFQSTNGNGVDCTDVNECTLDQNICGCNSLCKNNKGSYHCKCSPGFHSATGDGRNCKDINECEKGNVCGKGGKCVNMIGSYICLCFSKGFTYDPKMRSCLGSFTAAAGSKMYLYSPVIPLTGLFLKFAFRLAHF